MKRAEIRGHLIEVAAQVFNRAGYHAAGIDQVIAEAGVAKTTLYRHFKSKDDLIVAVLKRVDERFRDDMRRTVDALTADPDGKLLATFDFLEDWFKSESFRGCPFISAAREFAGRSNPIFQEAATHKRLVLAYFEELAHAVNHPEPQRIAREINLLHEGATAVAHVTGLPDAAGEAKAVAVRLLAE